jgi:putative ABC transport system permease protein
MSTIVRKTLSDIRRRKVQTFVVAVVVFLSCLAATLALTLLVESDAPFDRAFNRVAGAHLLVTFDANHVSEAQVTATRSLTPVSATEGPWPMSPASIVLPGGRTEVIPIAARSHADGAVDRLALDSGRWVQRTGEVAISRQLADRSGLNVGDNLASGTDSPFPTLKIVGVATSISDDATAWVEPSQFHFATSRNAPAQYLMAYRLYHASTMSEITSAEHAIAAAVPAGSVQDTSNYLEAKLNADRTTAVMIPFLLAFSAVALLASALIIANLVGGAVTAATREIGIMKSVGFTPAQVVTSIGGQMVIPAALGCIVGMPVGVLLSQPFLINTAHAFGLPRTFDPFPPEVWAGVAAILLVVIATSVLASWRAGRMNAAAAITSGSAPSQRSGAGLSRLAGRLPLPRPLSLGLGESFVRPVRSAMTVAAVVMGVATVTFAVGLHNSLTRVASAITRDRQVQLQIDRASATKSGQSEVSARQAASLIAAQPGTARMVGEGHVDVTVPGAPHPVPVTAYQGDASWLGYVPIHGRWFTAAGEAVAPTAFYTNTGYRLGDTITAAYDGRTVPFKLVGEFFDTQDDGVLLRTGTNSFPSPPSISNYEIQVRPGVDAAAYAESLGSSAPGLTSGLDVSLNRDNGVNTAFSLINSVLIGLAFVLALIAVSGVFNTVVLNTREKARDLGILKAVGMAPRHVITLIVASVTMLGIAGAAIGIPAGIALQHNILVRMGHIAAGTAIPKPFFNTLTRSTLALLGVAGIAIAIAGALVPALWAARSQVADVLQTE